MKAASIKPTSNNFEVLCKSYFTLQKQFDVNSIKQQEHFLKALLDVDLHDEALNLSLHEAILFTLAYPPNSSVFKLAELLMQKLVQTVTQQTKTNPDLYYNSGITGSLVYAQFGLILNQWLLTRKLSILELSAIDGNNSDLVSKLTFTLNSIEQELMPDAAGYFNEWNKMYLGSINNNEKLLHYYVNASMQMTGSVAYRESVFAGFDLYTKFCLDASLNGLSLGRQTKGEIYLHKNGIQKKANLESILQEGTPVKFTLNATDKEHLVNLARGTMASLLRETDTFTYAQIHETELYDMGKGISIALYFMIPEQKFALQSYIGYLLFKNGVPMAYGGCWLFAKQAAFGVNVLPPYRGGESANVVCQLLRLYSSRFNISQFTVDPYQIGKGNKDGISSGAFWFYYKLGFRPMQKKYATLAELEMQKMLLDQTYKTPHKILTSLANSELYRSNESNNAPYYSLLKVSEKISAHICNNYGGNRNEALQKARLKYKKVTGSNIEANSFLDNLFVMLDAMKVFKILPLAVVQKICNAFHLKGHNEAKAFLDLQKIKPFINLFN